MASTITKSSLLKHFLLYLYMNAIKPRDISSSMFSSPGIRTRTQTIRRKQRWSSRRFMQHTSVSASRATVTATMSRSTQLKILRRLWNSSFSCALLARIHCSFICSAVTLRNPLQTRVSQVGTATYSLHSSCEFIASTICALDCLRLVVKTTLP